MDPSLHSSSFSISKSPPGFILGPKIAAVKVTPIRNFLKNEKHHFWHEKDGSISRSTINYGWDFLSMEKDLYHFIDIPPIIQEIRKVVAKGFSPQLKNVIKPEELDNIIVTFYEPGQYLIPHYDADNSKNPLTKRNFYFDEPILGLVVEADPSIGFSFYYHDQEGRPDIRSKPIYQIFEEEGSTFLIQGKCRHAPFFHGIPPTNKLRISITMRRTILPENASGS